MDPNTVYNTVCDAFRIWEEQHALYPREGSIMILDRIYTPRQLREAEECDSTDHQSDYWRVYYYFKGIVRAGLDIFEVLHAHNRRYWAHVRSQNPS